MTKFGLRRLYVLVTIVVLFACLCLAVMLLFYPRERELHGLLVDLEFKEPDPARHRELREVITQRLRGEVPAAKDLKVSLGYVHFSEFTKDAVSSEKADFLILSPQGTPWHMYRNEAGRKLGVAQGVLRDLILDHDMPVMGICGGHQFMALAFGGSVGFIDPELTAAFPDYYPKNAISERGLVVLQTLVDDPILEGVTGHPGSFRVMESHYEEVKAIPRQFINLARSNLSEAQLMRLPGKPVYGMAFHPERSPNDETLEPALFEGKKMLANFLNMVAARRDEKH
jgi:GMP synthase (glutamine-hydrolysing)